MESLSFETWDKERVNKLLGKPRDIFKDEKNPLEEAWIYDHKTERCQEWAFGFNEKNKLDFIIYHPAGDFSLEFSLENIKKRWAKFNCEHKTKRTVYPDFIKDVKYISCDNGKRYIEYNKYNEVFSISVQK